MGRSISKVAMKLEISRTTISRVFREYCEYVRHQIYGMDGRQEKIMQGLCDESVRNLSTNLLRRLSGEYNFAYISNQLQEDEGNMQSR
ncbi:hypothetical protein TNCV_3262231 [Trichonephila clavipes]|nr:hypothetical protein TNCV_3262231 [Trichonephila clavipes]